MVVAAEFDRSVCGGYETCGISQTDAGSVYNMAPKSSDLKTAQTNQLLNVNEGCLSCARSSVNYIR